MAIYKCKKCGKNCKGQGAFGHAQLHLGADATKQWRSIFDVVNQPEQENQTIKRKYTKRKIKGLSKLKYIQGTISFRIPITFGDVEIIG